MATATDNRAAWLESIAEELGDGWKVHYGVRLYYLEHSATGTRLAISTCDYPAANRGKVSFSVATPAGIPASAYYRGERPSARVSESRPAAAIARDLERRLISAAQEWTAEQLRQDNENRLRTIARDEVAGRLAYRCGTVPRVFQDEPSRCAEFYVAGYSHSVSVRPGGLVDISVRGIDEATAAAVLAIIAK